MLETVNIKDYSDKPVLVCYTLNEEERLQWLCDYYGSIFHLIILDGGSRDKTYQVAEKNGCTIFKRNHNDFGLKSLLYFCENYTTEESVILFLAADEFIDIEDAKKSIDYVNNYNKIVYGRRYDWLYGKKLKRANSTLMPRIFHKGDIALGSSLHDGIVGVIKDDIKYQVPIQHFHVQYSEAYYGLFGSYAGVEVAEYIKCKKFPFFYIIKRFLLIEIYNLMKSILRDYKQGLSYLLICALMCSANVSIGFLCYLEHKKGLNRLRQLEFYRKFYYGIENTDI